MKGSGLFLLDSGGHYLEGTTDITRTWVLGLPEAQQKKDYTLVLKAHLQLARTPFPRGTKGYQLDGMTRGQLWSAGMNYGHGTGHGVGHVLCVHEGPAKISPASVNQSLEPGMVMSNEPGLYRIGKYGIRIENLQGVTPGFKNEFGEFYSWETFTMVPYESRLLDLGLLTGEEIDQIDKYHAQVKNLLQDTLNEEEKKWLLRATEPLEEVLK